MTVSRYRNDDTVKAGKLKASATAVMRIRQAVKRGSIPCQQIVVKEGERLDRLAQSIYGDGRLWWVIAATSNIGWWMQVPPGTRLWVPVDINSILGYV